MAHGGPYQKMFRRMVTERRKFKRGSLDWDWRTSAARKYLNLIRGIPSAEWPR